MNESVQGRLWEEGRRRKGAVRRGGWLSVFLFFRNFEDGGGLFHSHLMIHGWEWMRMVLMCKGRRRVEHTREELAGFICSMSINFMYKWVLFIYMLPKGMGKEELISCIMIIYNEIKCELAVSSHDQVSDLDLWNCEDLVFAINYAQMLS